MVSFLALFIMPLLCAKDFGTEGLTYEIAEESLLDHLYQRLSTVSEEDLLKKQLEIGSRVQATIQNPSSGLLVRKANVRRSFTIDPTITLHKDVQNHEGKIVVAKGTSYNPLRTVTLKDALLFLDGTDPKQLQWARAQGDATKWILVKGSPLEGMKTENRPIYFDQGGSISKHFKIDAYPAKIVQESTLIRVEEIPLEDANES